MFVILCERNELSSEAYYWIFFYTHLYFCFFNLPILERGQVHCSINFQFILFPLIWISLEVFIKLLLFYYVSQDLHKLEQYLPLLQNFIFHAHKGSHSCIYQWTSDLKIRWTSSLSPSSSFILRGAKFFQIDDLRFELVMTLFLFGAMLRNRALEVLPLGGY